MTRPLLGLLLLLATSCGASGPTSEPPPEPEPDPAAASGPGASGSGASGPGASGPGASGPAASAPLVDVPSGWVEETVADDVLYITERAVFRGQQGAAAPILTLHEGQVPEEAGRGRRIPAVEAAVEEPATLQLGVAPSVPFETLVRVLDSVGRAREYTLLVRRGERVMGLPLFLRSTPAPASPRPALAGVLGDHVPPAVGLELTVRLGEAGITVSGGGGTLAPGCEQLGHADGPTLPGPVDGTALAACLRNVKAEFPDEDVVTLIVPPQTPFARVVAVMVAARGTAEAPLFPLQAIGAPAE